MPHDFRPRGAREVRQAALAFLEMRDRIRHHVEQRTTMLAGVSHDLRTVLTRFKLELALLGDSPEIAALQQRRQRDAAHARGLPGLRQGRRRRGGGADQRRRAAGGGAGGDRAPAARRSRCACASPSSELVLPLKRQAFKRAVTNLVTNAARFGDYVVIRAAADEHWLRIEVDDDGPGIPPAERDNVFRPFYRLDHARNQDDGQHRARPRHRPRHRAQPRRRHRPGRQLDGRPARHHPRAAVGSPACSATCRSSVVIADISLREIPGRA